MTALISTDELAIKRDLLRIETRRLMAIVALASEWVEMLEPNRIEVTKLIEDKRINWMLKSAVADMRASILASITLTTPEKTSLVAIVDTIVVDANAPDVDDTYFNDMDRAKVVQAIDDHFDVEYLLLAGETYRPSNVPAVVDHVNEALGVKTS